MSIAGKLRITLAENEALHEEVDRLNRELAKATGKQVPATKGKASELPLQERMAATQDPAERARIWRAARGIE